MNRFVFLFAIVSVFLHLYATDYKIYENIHVWSTVWHSSDGNHLEELPLKQTYYIQDIELVNNDELKVLMSMTFELLTEHQAYVEGEEVTIHFVPPGTGRYSNFIVLNEYSVHRDYDFVLNEKKRSVSFDFTLRERSVSGLPTWRFFDYIVTFSRYLFEAESVKSEELANHYRQIRLPITYKRYYEIPETWKGKRLGD